MPTTTRNLLTEFTCAGRWWLPEHPDHPVFGKLTYEPRGQIRLELMGTMRSGEIADRVFRLSSFAKWDVILGLCEDGTFCTLLDIREISGPLLPSESGRSILVAERLFMGTHFSSVNAIVFQNAILEYTYLEDWVRARTFHVKLENEGRKRVVEFSAEPLTLADIAIETRNAHLGLYSGVDAKESVGKSFEARARAWSIWQPRVRKRSTALLASSTTPLGGAPIKELEQSCMDRYKSGSFSLLGLATGGQYTFLNIQRSKPVYF